MAYNKYVESKYSCNHPESDFEQPTTNPIEMKKENFTEYTYRYETANMQYDVWGNSDSTARLYKNAGNYSAQTQYGRGNSSNNTKKSSGGLGALIIIFVFWGLPLIIEIIAKIFEELF